MFIFRWMLRIGCKSLLEFGCLNMSMLKFWLFNKMVFLERVFNIYFYRILEIIVLFCLKVFYGDMNWVGNL